MRNQKFAFLIVFVAAVLALVAVSCDNSSGSPKVYTVTVDFGDGFEKITKEVKEGEKFTLPGAETKDGFVFDYYTDADGGKHSAGEEVTVNADMTFTAKWTALYVVKVDNADGTAAKEWNVRSGESFTLPAEPEKEGYVFLCYKDGEGKEYKAGDSVKVENAITFTAEWREKTDKKFIVIVDYGFESKSESVSDGEKFKLPAAVERTDYEFVAYKYGDATYNAGDSVTVVSDMTFTAEWVRLYTLTVNSNNGKEKTTQKVRAGEFTLPQAPENGDAVFKAWKLGDKEYKAGEKITVGGDIEIKALWMTYTVTFKDGDTVVDTKTVESGHPVDKTDKTITKDGYTFTGWSYNSANYDFTTPVTKDIVLEAVWLEKGKVTVTLRENGTERVSTIESGADFKIPEPVVTKKGYTFKNWKSGETEYSSGETITGVTESIVIEAQYEVNIITVTFKYTDKDGTAKTDERKNLKAGTVVEAPVFETAEGKEFSYWYLENGSLYDSVNLPKAFYEDTVLVAVISDVYLTVTFNYNDGGKTEDYVVNRISYNSTIEYRKPSDPVRSGYTFLGWFKNLEDETAFDVDKDKVTEDFTLYAKWEEVKDENSVTLTLKGDADEEKGIAAFSNEYKFKKDSTISLYNIYDYTTDNAYAINKWVDDKKAEYDKRQSLKLTDDLTLTAVWEKKEYSVTLYLNGGKYIEEKEEYSGASFEKKAGWNQTFSDVFKGEFSKVEGEIPYVIDFWSNDPFGYERYDETQKITTDHLSLYAVWKTDKTCTVTFNYGYEDKTETKTVTYGTYVDEPVRPVREGYSFTGWYSSETEQFDFSSEITENVAVTAGWTEVQKYTVTYMNVDGATPYTTEDVLPGKTADGAMMPSLSGMEAVGWYRIIEGPLDYYGSPYDFSTPVQEDIKLMPKYIPSEEKMLGSWSFNVSRGNISIDFREEDGERVFYLTDIANNSSNLVKSGTWNYDPENGELIINTYGVDAVMFNAMSYGYAIYNLGETGEYLEDYAGYPHYRLTRTSTSNSLKGTWNGEKSNWKININFSDNSYEDQRVMYKDITEEEEVITRIDTNGDYEISSLGKGVDGVMFLNMGYTSATAIGTQKSTFHSWLVFATADDSIAIGGFFGESVLQLVRE